MTAPVTQPDPTPDVIDALVALAQGARTPDGALEGVRVDDGDPGEFSEPRALGIGVAVRQTDETQDRPQQGLRSTDHEFDVICVAQAVRGTPAELRRQVYAIKDALDGLLEQNRQLGLSGRVLQAYVDAASFDFGQTKTRQPIAILEFAVHVKAYRRRR